MLAQIALSQHLELNRLHTATAVNNSATRISDEQIRDLMYELQQARITEEAEKTKWFVAGVVAATARPDHYNEVWHAGYDRGQSVQAQADALDKSAIFTNGK
ncbi:MAG: hypothetical protein EBS53_17545 [Bacteroidetes bacterium]|nr:hypothetical protein [Bacteroidota bacterium]